MTWSLEGRPLRAVLVSRLRYLGDVVMSTPVLAALKAGDPDLRLGYLAERAHGRVLQGHPLVGRLHLLDSRRRGPDAARRSVDRRPETGAAQSTLGMVQELRHADYDLALDLFFNPRSSWLLRLAGCRHRIGGTAGSRRHLFTHVVRPDRFRNPDGTPQVVAPGGLGEHLGRLAPLRHEKLGVGFLEFLGSRFGPHQLRPTLPRDYWSRFAPAGPGDGTAGQAPILLAPSATWPSKEWPRKNWGVFCRELARATERPILVIQAPGRKGDYADVLPVEAGSNIQLLPVLDLPEVLGLLANAALLVSVDGGIMHAGVGLGTPTVGLFGPTRPDLWFPYEGMGPYRVLATAPHCAPCDRHECGEFICLPELGPDRVLQISLELLGQDRREAREPEGP